MATWRETYAPRIAKIISDNDGKPVKELKKMLSEMNPGPYGWMKKVWSNEYMIQLGLSKRKKQIVDKNQPKLF